MRKPIFESEDEFNDFYFNMWGTCPDSEIKKAKICGYIKRSPIEEAEEMKQDLWERGYFESCDNKLLKYMDKLIEAIAYLRKQLEEK